MLGVLSQVCVWVFLKEQSHVIPTVFFLCHEPTYEWKYEKLVKQQSMSITL